MDYERHPADPSVAFGRRDDGSEYLFVPGELITDGEDDKAANRLEGIGAAEETTSPPPTPDPRVVGAQRSAFLPRRDSDGNPITWRPEPDPRPTTSRGLAHLDRGRQRDARPALQELNQRRWYLPEGEDTLKVLNKMRREKRSVQPNHVFALQPWWFGNPGSLPTPIEAFGPPDRCQGSVSVTVLDTGIRPGWADDDWFASRIDAGDDDVEELDADVDNRRDPQAGHGTFIAGVVANRAPDAQVKARRLLSSFGLTSDVLLAEQIHQLAGTINGGVLSLSLGGYTFDDNPPKLLTKTLRQLDSDTLVVAAAGNNSSSRPFYPAALHDVVAVGSVSEGDNRARSPFSNFGDWVDCYAVGENVDSTMIVHDGPVIGSPDSDNFQGYARWSGTSFAAPRIAAIVAQRAYKDGTTAREAWADLIDGAPTIDPGPIFD